jgi:hypothetical protein
LSSPFEEVCRTARATEWNPIAYVAAMGIYFSVAALALLAVSTFADQYTARAVLITTGWTMLSLTTLSFTKTIPIFISRIEGSDPVMTSIKTIMNTLLGATITKAIFRALGVATIGGFLFYIFTFMLGIFALVQGYLMV